MKLAIAQLNYTISDFVNNEKKIIKAIKQAKTENCKLIIFSETCVCGYTPYDLLLYNEYIQQCEAAVLNIAKHCTDITAIIGSPTTNISQGKSIFNSALVLQNQEVLKTIHKTLLPYYDIFNEQRYFEKGNLKNNFLEIDNCKIAITICEDIWYTDSLYNTNTLEEIYIHKPDLVMNLSASPFSKSQYKNRISTIKHAAKYIEAPIVYVNQVGANSNLIFDGNSVICDKKGTIIAALESFKEDSLIANFDKETQEFLIDKNIITKDNYCASDDIIAALILGIQDYFRKTKFTKAILGLSGGIDSALSLVLACLALGEENVMAVLMPSEFSSEHSVNDSLKLVSNIGCKHKIIPINKLYKSFLETLEESFESLPRDSTEENLQARIRANLLYALSNKFNMLVLNTSNKSELAVGYGTLYGDMCGAISVIGDLYKTEVYQLSKHINSIYNNTIPENIITKEPSAELSYNQKDSDTLPNYDLLDKILELYIDKKLSMNEIINKGFDKYITEQIINLINRNEYKRAQFAPILRVSKNCFTDAWKMPIVKNIW